MDELSTNAIRLLKRIRDAEGGKLAVSDLDEDDQSRLADLDARGMLVYSDPYFPKNIPGSGVYTVGPIFQSVSLSTRGKDELSKSKDKRFDSVKSLARDIFLLFLGSIITLVLTFLFNQLTASTNGVEDITVAENSPALVTPAPGFNSAALE